MFIIKKIFIPQRVTEVGLHDSICFARVAMNFEAIFIFIRTNVQFDFVDKKCFIKSMIPR